MNFTQNPLFTWLRKTRVLMLSIVLLSFTISSCDDDDDDVTPPGPTQNIVALAQGNSNLSSLVSALTIYPDLVSTLSSTSTDFTVFAPTNAAFSTFLTAIGQTSINDIPEDVLREVLEYHVVAGAAVLSTQLTAGPVETVNGEDITVTTSGGIRLNSTVSVTTADVEATNGVVHVIDAVLVPPSIVPIVGTIVAPAYFNKNFSTLIAAVRAASPAILTTLLNSTQKTLFAPTNAAFEAAGITELPNQATLDAVLTYHVISGAAVEAGDIADGSSVATTLGGDIYLSKGTAGVFINGTSQVTTADVAASNGVVHVINRTLLPPSQTIQEIAIANDDFSILVQALQRRPDLLAATAADGALTVFAPTNAAFVALLEELDANSLDDIDNATLDAVLQHHIIATPRVFSTDLPTGDFEATTLNGTIVINGTAGTITDGSDRVSNLEGDLLNILATNGVIHAIDKVLLP